MGRNARRKHEQRQKGVRGSNDRPLKRCRRKWIVAAALLLALIGAVAAWHWNGNLWGYRVAPSFTLQASTGQLVSLRDYLGKQEVVIIFYMGAG
jgi:hypothetical protein